MITIITTTYNRSNLLPACFESLKQQTRVDLIDAWVIVDDGSNDDTKEVVRAFDQSTFLY